MGAYLLLKILGSPWGQYLWLLSWNSSPQWHLGHPWMIWTFTENCFTSCLSNAILFRMSILRQALLLLANEFPFLWQCSPGYDTTFTSVLCLLWIRPSIPRTELSCNSLLAFTQSTLCPLLPPPHTQKNCHPLYFLLCPALYYRNQIRGNIDFFSTTCALIDPDTSKKRVLCSCLRKLSNLVLFSA